MTNNAAHHTTSSKGASMSHYLVELYSPKPGWLALPAVQRSQFLDGIKAGMGGLGELGVEILMLGQTEPGIDQASGHRFLGIWRLPDARARDALLAGIKASGWYDHFEHVNAAGAGSDFSSHLAELANA
ncbi:DUF6616 family protein [Variovorax paradoxus]|uniref:Uncharacterized protein n=1 Tax=Variovorax paradoxus TaxID=34073 RepID=A0AAW8EJ97_VARPD|nr:DUF6616 family protein [Variovorax paradoxus]MDP9972960.1 hypothetical protein [Variovorax paradoxus]